MIFILFSIIFIFSPLFECMYIYFTFYICFYFCTSFSLLYTCQSLIMFYRGSFFSKIIVKCDFEWILGVALLTLRLWTVVYQSVTNFDFYVINSNSLHVLWHVTHSQANNFFLVFFLYVHLSLCTSVTTSNAFDTHTKKYIF